jgi:hypothetical protein
MMPPMLMSVRRWTQVAEMVGTRHADRMFAISDIELGPRP